MSKKTNSAAHVAATEIVRWLTALVVSAALLDQLAQVLYEKETITGEEFMRILHAAQKEEEHHA